MAGRFPKTLFGFYAREAARPFAPILGLWALFFAASEISGDVLMPLMQEWFVSLFEAEVPAGATFIQFALPVILGIVAIWFAIDACEIMQSILMARWRPRVRNRLSEILNDYVHSQSMSFWTGRMPGKISAQIGLVAGGFTAVRNFMEIFCAAAAIAVSSALVFAIINPKVAYIMAGALAFRLIYSMAMMRPMNRAAKTASESGSTLNGKMMDSIANYSIVKLFAGAEKERAHLDAPRKENIRDQIRASFIQRLFWGVPSFVWNVAFGLVMLECVLLYQSGGIKISEIVYAVSAYIYVMRSISNLVHGIPDLVDVIGGATQAYRELVVPIDVLDAPGAPALNVTRGAIDIENISFKYHRKMVLDDFSLSVKPGEKVGLVGGSGAGKTTLVNLLMRLYDPAKGAIFIDGQNIRGVTSETLRRSISFIPQDPALFNRTLKDNIAYGAANAAYAEVRRAAKSAEADGFIMASDKKYDSIVGDRGIKLSGGQKQRVAIARAFMKNAPILILDEATSALDSETERAVQKSFAELSRGRTTIVVAHRLSTLRHMDRIVVIENGKIAEQGTHAALLKKRGGIYAGLWKMQSGGFIGED
ncbi:MAG: ABC transporter ATP-binding protein/permease [Rickettsiales bacterium]|jgi:ABC-type multidrug transport system fused ATPase/permease subunit|nr:ABC transporter ATP-binding protein/permease [Rickettsiales bacterium]